MCSADTSSPCAMPPWLQLSVCSIQHVTHECANTKTTHSGLVVRQNGCCVHRCLPTTEQDQFTKREQLRSVRAVVRVLIRRGSMCFHSESRVHQTRMTYQLRPQTRVCQPVGSSAFLKVQPNHLDLFLKRPDSTFRRIRRTVVPRRSFQNNQIKKKFMSLQVPPSPVLRRNASGLFVAPSSATRGLGETEIERNNRGSVDSARSSVTRF